MPATYIIGAVIFLVLRWWGATPATPNTEIDHQYHHLKILHRSLLFVGGDHLYSLFPSAGKAQSDATSGHVL
jgi:hypothetical protein